MEAVNYQNIGAAGGHDYPLPSKSTGQKNHHLAVIALSYHDQIFKLAVSLLKQDRDRAADLVQQLYLEILEGKVHLENAQKPLWFLLGVLRRLASSRRRKEMKRARLLQAATPWLFSEFCLAAKPSAAVERAEWLASIDKAMAVLPARQLEITRLVFLHDLTVIEAAMQMELSIGTARIHYHRAKRRLAKLLTPEK